MILCADQMEINKKREAELQRLRRDLEESSIQSETLAATMRKRHGDVIAELSEQCEALQRTRAKLEKEKQSLRMEVDDLSTSLDGLQKAKVCELGISSNQKPFVTKIVTCVGLTCFCSTADVLR